MPLGKLRIATIELAAFRLLLAGSKFDNLYCMPGLVHLGTRPEIQHAFGVVATGPNFGALKRFAHVEILRDNVVELV